MWVQSTLCDTPPPVNTNWWRTWYWRNVGTTLIAEKVNPWSCIRTHPETREICGTSSVSPTCVTKLLALSPSNRTWRRVCAAQVLWRRTNWASRNATLCELSLPKTCPPTTSSYRAGRYGRIVYYPSQLAVFVYVCVRALSCVNYVLLGAWNYSS